MKIKPETCGEVLLKVSGIKEERQRIFNWLLENGIIVKDFDDYFTADDGGNITELVEKMFGERRA